MADIPDSVTSVLDDSMSASLVGTAEIGADTYYLVDLSNKDAGDGEMVIVRLRGGLAEVVSDVPVPDSTSGGGAALSLNVQERLDAWRNPPEEDSSSGGAPPILLSKAQISEKFLTRAKHMAATAFSSATAPGTDGGNLACAWAVNQVARKGLGREIGGGLATANMVPILRAKHQALADVSAGAVVISASATVGKKWVIGHVGVVGDVNAADKGATPIYSNSSAAAEFQKNFTLSKWIQRYKTTKGLKVEFFQLEPGQFPDAATIPTT
jgi:hypothetical protein